MKYRIPSPVARNPNGEWSGAKKLVFPEMSAGLLGGPCASGGVPVPLGVPPVPSWGPWGPIGPMGGAPPSWGPWGPIGPYGALWGPMWALCGPLGPGHYWALGGLYVPWALCCSVGLCEAQLLVFRTF